MPRPPISILAITAIFLFAACAPAAKQPDTGQIENQVATKVAATLTALAGAATPTNTLLPTPTQPILPTVTLLPPPTIVQPTSLPAVASEYECNTISQKPLDDTEFHRNETFFIEWTIVNSGTQKWEPGTALEYQSGPRMTTETSVKLPEVKPGEQYKVVLDAVAPTEKGRQIMVWAVKEPGKTKNSFYWMCYPYIRIIVLR